jgi:hypothetical protein
VVNATPRPLYPRERPGTNYTGGAIEVDPKPVLKTSCKWIRVAERWQLFGLNNLHTIPSIILQPFVRNRIPATQPLKILPASCFSTENRVKITYVITAQQKMLNSDTSKLRLSRTPKISRYVPSLYWQDTAVRHEARVRLLHEDSDHRTD